MTALGLRIMVDMMNRTDRFKMLCVEPGTHPQFWSKKQRSVVTIRHYRVYPELSKLSTSNVGNG